MATETVTTEPIDTTAQAEALAGRLFNATVEALDLVNVYIGDKLGLYRSLADHGSATPPELAVRARIHPRYAREWLEQQAASSILEVDDPSKPEDERRFSLPTGHATALLDRDAETSIAPVAAFLVSSVVQMPKILEAIRTGGGVSWTEYGRDATEAQGDFNRPWIKRQLGREYLPQIEQVHKRLVSDPPARVADLACGVGLAAIAIAQAYPLALVDGFDLDPIGIELARKQAAEARVGNRVTFAVRDIADPAIAGGYDLVIIVEALHDLSDPVGVLANMRRMLAPGGVAIVADEKVGDSFVGPADEWERLLYGFSVILCLPGAMAEEPHAGTGVVFRQSKLRQYAANAGFPHVEVLDQIDHQFLRFYLLEP